MEHALIFDVDGTLAETEELHRRAFNETFADVGLDWHWSVDMYRDLLRVTGGKERMCAYRDQCGLAVPSDDEIAALHSQKTKRYGDLMTQGDIPLRPGIREIITAARAANLRLAVATTTNRPNVEALCRACFDTGANDIFDVIAAGDEVATKKPAPDVYLLALDRLGIAASRAVAFEDSRNGLLSAKAAELAVIVTPSIYTSHEDFAGASMVVDQIPPFHALVTQMKLI